MMKNVYWCAVLVVWFSVTYKYPYSATEASSSMASKLI